MSGGNKIYDNIVNSAGAIRMQGAVEIASGTLGDQTGLENYQISLSNSACGTNDCYNGMALVTPDADRSWVTIFDYDGTSKVAYVSPGYGIHPSNGEIYSVMQRTRLIMRDGNEVFGNEGIDPAGKAEPAAIQLRDGASGKPNLVYENLSNAVGGRNNILINIYGGNRIYGNPEFGIAISNRGGAADSHSYLTVEGNYIYNNCTEETQSVRHAIAVTPWMGESKITMTIANNRIYDNRNGGGVAIATLAGPGSGEGIGYVDGIIQQNEIYGKDDGVGIFLGENAGVSVIKNYIHNNKWGFNIWNSALETEVENGVLPGQTGQPNNQVVLGSGASTTGNYYKGMTLKIPGADPGWVTVYDYDGPLRTAYVTPAYSSRVSSGDAYTVTNNRYVSKVGDGTDEGRNYIYNNKGAGFAIYASSAVIDNNEIYSNGSVAVDQYDAEDAQVSGSGIITQNSPNLKIRNNLIHNNYDSGIKARNGAVLTIENNKIYSNGIFGMGFDGNTSEWVNALIKQNEIYNNGHLTGDGGGISASEYARLEILENDIHDNQTTGIQFLDNVDVTVDRTKIHRNTGEGIRFDMIEGDYPPKIFNSFIYKNYYGIRMRNSPPAGIQIYNNTIVYNLSFGMSSIYSTVGTGSRGGQASYGGALCGSATIRNTVLWGNSAMGWYGTCQTYSPCMPISNIDSSIIECTNEDDYSGFCKKTGWYDEATCTASGCSNLAPAFVDAANDDYHLVYNSEGVDDGNDIGIAWDYDLDGRPAGSAYDAGADEYSARVVNLTLEDADGANDPEAGYTNDTLINVTVEAVSADQMKLSEYSDFSDVPSWSAYQSSVTFTLSSSDGGKTVYCKVKDSNGGNESGAVSSSIVLDTATPTGVSLTYPVGGEIWNDSFSKQILWNSTAITDGNLKDNPIKLYYSTNGGSNYRIIGNTNKYRTARLRVKLPALAAGDSTVVYLYGNNPSASDESNYDNTFPAVSLPDCVNCAAQWHFEEGSGATAYDSSGNNLDGTITGSYWKDGKFGKALWFTGSSSSDDVVIVQDDDALTPASSITIEAWIKPGSPNGTKQYIVQKADNNPQNSYSFFINGSGNLEFWIYDTGWWEDHNGGYTGDTVLSGGNWYQVAVVWDGGIITFYINGEPDPATPQSWSAGLFNNSTPLYIGRRFNSTSSDLFRGDIEEVTIYGRPLSAQEIKDNYHQYDSPQLDIVVGLAETGSYNGWNYRWPVSVTNKGYGALSTYQGLIEVDQNQVDFSLFEAGGNDVHFTDSSDQTLNYWRESWDVDGVNYKTNNGSYDWSPPAVQTTRARVKLMAYDRAGNSAEDASNNFTLANQDIVPPYTAEHDPLPSAVLNNSVSRIAVLVKDEGEGVDINSLEMTVDDRVYSNGSAHLSVSGSTAASYLLTYTPVYSLEVGQRVEVTVKASDLAGNVMTPDSYWFDIFPDGVVTLWHFDEGNGSIIWDSSANNYDGWLKTAGNSIPAWTAAGRQKNALSFNGTDNYIMVENEEVASGLTTGTVELWFKLSSQHQPGGSDGWLLSKREPNGGFGLQLRGIDGKLWVYLSNAERVGSSRTDWEADRWYHVTAAWNGANVSLYVDGILDNWANYTGGSGSFTTKLDIGRWGYAGGGGYFSGTIDEIVIYANALSGQEIQTRYNAYNSSAPAQPANSSPADLESGVELTPTLVSGGYYDADGDGHYATRWQIRPDSSYYGGTGSYDSGAGSDLTGHTLPAAAALAFSSDYYWRVAHIASDGRQSAWSEETQFTTRQAGSNTAPDAPLNVSPADGAGNVPLIPALQSSDFSDSDSGDVQAASWWQISTISNDYSPPFHEMSTSFGLTEYTLPVVLTSGTSYYWRVRHQDVGGKWSDYSNQTQFTADTDNPPDQPANSFPDGDSDINVTPVLSASEFSDVEDGATWTDPISQWQIRRDGGNYGDSDSYDSGPMAEGTSHQVAAALNFGNAYYWRARYQDSSGSWSLYSSETSFTTEAVIPSGMVAYWKFEENQGNTASDETGDNNGIILGADWTTTGKNGNALSFDDKDYLKISNSASLDSITEEVTVEAWVKGYSGMLGDGSDGSQPNLSGTVNGYAYVSTETIYNGSSVIVTVDDSSVFTAGADPDEVLIIQMQHTDINQAGKYEFAQVTGISGNDITLDNVSADYYSGSSDTDPAIVTQLVRVPQYEDVTIAGGDTVTAGTWDGTRGGVLIFRARGTVTVDGTISADYQGYRGAVTRAKGGETYSYRYGGGDSTSGGQGGDANAGGGGGGSNTNYSGGAGSAGGGGGAGGFGGCGCDAGGGGGGYGSYGYGGTMNCLNGSQKQGEDGWNGDSTVVGVGGGGGSSIGPSYRSGGGGGGASYGSETLNNLYPGSGGGGGGSECYDLDYAGGSGGGIVYIIAGELTVTGTGSIQSQGKNGVPTGNCNAYGAICGAGGGGSGGAIHLRAQSLDLGTDAISVTGGSGWGGSLFGYGGKGRIRLDYTTLSGTVDSSFYGSRYDKKTINTVLSKENSYGIGLTETACSANLNDSSISSTLTPAGWNHIVMTYDGSLQKLYINASLAASQPLAELINVNVNNLIIGKDSYEYFNGTLDEIVLYNRALTLPEIQDRFDAGGRGGYGGAPDRPSNLSPEGAGISLRPALVSSPYFDTEYHAHLASRWQSRKAGGNYGGSGSYDSGTVSDLTGHTLPLSDTLVPSTGYYWRVQHRDSTAKWSLFSDETYFSTRINNAPDQPGNQQPTAGAGSQSLNPTLAASGFSDQDSGDLAEAHKTSRWQIITRTDYDNLSGYTEGQAYTSYTYQTSTTLGLTRITIEDSSLSPGAAYYWHVQYQDVAGAWSGYSISTSFTTDSGNSRPDRPVNKSPANGNPAENRSPILLASDFSDTEDGGAGTSGQWQIAADSSFGDIVYDSGPVPFTTINVGGNGRWPIVINNSLGSTFSGHQVEITLTDSSIFSEFQPDGSDAYFTTSDGLTPIDDFWVQSWNSLSNAATVWVKVPSLAPGDTTIYLYNAGSSTGDYSNTFTKIADTTAQGCVGRWHFDEASDTTVYDLSGSSPANDGTIFGAAWQGTDGGRWDGASQTFSNGDHLEFIPSDYIAVTADNPSLKITGTAITLEAWIYPYNTGEGGGSRIISKRTTGGGSDVYCIFLYQGDIWFRLNSYDYISSNDPITLNAWNHVVATYDGSGGATDSVRLYINGQLDSAFPRTKSGSLNIDDSSRAVHLGMREGQSRYFNGRMDELAIYNRGFSAEEVQDHYYRRQYASVHPGVSGMGAREGINGTVMNKHQTGAVLGSGTNYRWRVRYQDSAGAWSDYSVQWSFTTLSGTGGAPDKPINIYPEVANTGVSLIPALTASAFSDADGDTQAAARWQVRPESGIYGGSGSYDSGETSSDLTGHTLPASAALVTDGVYYWRVQYKDSSGNWSAYSDETYFTARSNQKPGTPVNQSPADDESGLIIPLTLAADSFSDSDSASDSREYHRASWWRIRQYDDPADYSSPRLDISAASDLTAYSVPAGILTVNMEYYWQVSYQDAGKLWSDWSGETSFRSGTNHRPDKPGNSTPAAGTTLNDTSPTLTASDFTDVDTGDSHQASQWQISKVQGDYGAADLVYDSGPITGTTNHAVNTTLSYGTTYYWRVRYQDDQSGWSYYSDDTSFTTQFAFSADVMDYWSFDENSGSVAYDEAGGRNANLYGAPNWATGRYGSALEFNGGSDYLYIPQNVPLDFTNATIELWFLSGAGGQHFIMDTPQESGSNCQWYLSQGLRHQDNGNLEDFSRQLVWRQKNADQPYGEVYLPGSKWNADQWNHLVITVTATESKLYLNGGELAGGVESTGSGCTCAFTGARMWIGQRFYTGGNYDHPSIHRWQGKMDEIIFYNRALTAQEVKERYMTSLKGDAFAPNRPGNVAPADSATGVSLRADLQASAYSDPHGYPHQLSRWQIRETGGTYGSGSYELTSQSDLVSHTLPAAAALKPSTSHYWRVQYQNNNGDWSNYSQETSFETRANTTPDQPVNQSPVDQTGVNRLPALDASAFSDIDSAADSREGHQASRWQITTISNDYTPPAMVGSYTTTPESELTSYTPPDTLNSNTAYYWRVSYQDVWGEWSVFSNQTSFTTGTGVSPDQPVNLSPVAPDNTSVSPTPGLVSSDFSDENAPPDTHFKSQWQMRLASGSYGDTDSYDSGDSGDLTGHAISAALPYNAAYYWRVRHQSDNGDWSFYSDETSFTTTAVFSGAAAYWKFDESTGSTAKEEINGNDGTINGSTWSWVTAGNRDNALYLGGADYVEVNDQDNLDITGAGTVEAWIYPTTFSSNQALVAKGDAAGNNINYSLRLDTGGKPGLEVWDGSAWYNVQGSVAVTLNQWNQVVFTYDDAADEVLLYVNGANAGWEQDYSYSFTADNYPLMIGNLKGSSQLFTGRIDEVVIYDRALSGAEIKERYGTFISSIAASDNLGQGDYIQTGDQVIFTFDGPTWGRSFDLSDIDNVLQLNNGHSWLSVSGTIENAVWSDNVYSNDTLTITLNADGGAPSIAAGDTVLLDGVTLWDKTGKPMTGSGTISGDFSNKPPFAPAGTYPADGATNITLQPELRSAYFADQDIGFYNPDNWDAHANSLWEISTLSNAQFEAGMVYNSGAVNDLLAHTLPNSKYLTTYTLYYWRLKHQDDEGAWSDYSVERTFTTTQKPNQPSAIGFDGVEDLTCNLASPFDPDGDNSNASKWRVKLESDSVYSNGYDSGAVSELTRHTVMGYLATNNVYDWQVRHQDDKLGWSDWSAEATFYTIGLNFRPVKPVNQSPTSSNISRAPTLAASAFSDPDGDSHYASQWQISADSTFSNIVYDSQPVSETTKTEHQVPSSLTGATTYYWRVRYRDLPGTWSFYSDGAAFTTDSNTSPNQPGNLSPVHDTDRVSLNPTLAASDFSDSEDGNNWPEKVSQWRTRKADGAYDGDSGYNSGFVSDGTSHVTGATLDYNNAYYWQVRYRDSAGAWSLYSNETSFTTVTGVLGDGSDGDQLNLSGTVNAYAYVEDTTIGSGSSVAIAVDNASGFAAGNEVMIIQMQYSDVNRAGKYQFAVIDSIVGTSVTLDSLSNTYYSGSPDTDPAAVTQLVKVPQYKDATISGGETVTAPVWNGRKGGMVVFRSQGKVTVQGTISANGRGYRGASARGEGGETYSYLYGGGTATGGGNGGGANAGGGGGAGGFGGCGCDSGAGGGGYGSPGDGGTTNTCSGEYGQTGDTAGAGIGGKGGNENGGRSGGGGGGSTCYSLNYPGGAGSGIIYIVADEFTLTGSLQSNGGNGVPSGGCNSYGDICGGGGGGGGGAIYLKASNLTVGNDLVTVQGGAGWKGKGDGGGGRIRLDYTSFSGTINSADYGSKYEGAFGGDNSAPGRPDNAVLSSPVSLTPTLSASAFTDPQGDTQAASQWQIRETGGIYGDPNSYGTTVSGQITSHTVEALTPGTLYYWRTQYQDTGGAWSTWSFETTFTTRSNTAPDPPNGLSPDNQSDIETMPTLSASEFSDTDKITDPTELHRASHWQITTEKGNYTNPTELYTYTTTSQNELTSYTIPAALTTNTRYWWQLEYQDAAGDWSGYSTEASFITTADIPPDQPQNNSPANGSNGVSNSPTLSASQFSDTEDAIWNPTVSQWQISVVSNDYNSPNLVYASGPVNDGSSYQVAASLDYESTHYWRVRYQDSNGAWSLYSDEWSFTVKSNCSINSNLEDLSRYRSDIGWGSIGTDVSVEGNTLTINGVQYADGIGTHSPSDLRWDLNQAYCRLTGKAGLDDESNCDDGVIFYLYGDYVNDDSSWTLLWQSGTQSWGTPASSFDVDLTGVYNLRIYVSPITNNWCDHADIVEPVLYVTSSPSAPAQPTNYALVSPTSLTPPLSADAFTDPDGDTMTSSRWRIRKSSGAYGDPNSYGTTVTGQTTSFTVPAGELTDSTLYYWHVNYKDDTDAWSAWSSETSFTTQNP